MPWHLDDGPVCVPVSPTGRSWTLSAVPARVLPPPHGPARPSASRGRARRRATRPGFERLPLSQSPPRASGGGGPTVTPTSQMRKPRPGGLGGMPKATRPGLERMPLAPDTTALRHPPEPQAARQALREGSLGPRPRLEAAGRPGVQFSTSSAEPSCTSDSGVPARTGPGTVRKGPQDRATRAIQGKSHCRDLAGLGFGDGVFPENLADSPLPLQVEVTPRPARLDDSQLSGWPRRPGGLGERRGVTGLPADTPSKPTETRPLREPGLSTQQARVRDPAPASA